MKGFIFLIFLIAIFVLIDAIRRKSPTRTGRIQPPYFEKALLTEPEQVLFHRLKMALPEKHIFCQVAMSALIGIRKNSDWQRQFNEISRKYVDFVICNPDLSVVAIVELDDTSHQRGDRIKSDAIKESAFNLINYKVIRFDVRDMPETERIKNAFTENS